MTSTRLHIKLPVELARFVSDKVRSGEYTGEEEVIRDGLELLQSFEEYRSRKLKRLRD